MRCYHDWQLLPDIYAYKCSKCLEVRKHPTVKDDCPGHDYQLLMDGSESALKRSGIFRCEKCFKLSAKKDMVLNVGFPTASFIDFLDHEN